jgi:glycosyltransferase involved in cell wall biosynthesis
MIISIITVSYNSAATIEDTLRSVAKQDYPTIEHIIVDGGSNDGTLKIIENQGAHVAKLISEPDDGIFDAMNKGLRLATGDIIGFLNSDDIFETNNIVSTIAQTLGELKYDCCYGDLVYVEQSNLNRVVRYWKSQSYRAGLFDRGWVPAHPTFYAKREVYEQLGNFDIQFRLAADFDILLRFFMVHKISSVYIPKVMVRMRLGGASNISYLNIYKQNIEIARSFKKNGFSNGIKPFVFKLFDRATQFLYRP